MGHRSSDHVDLTVVRRDGHPELLRVNRRQAWDVVSHRALTDGRRDLCPDLFQHVLKIHAVDCVLPRVRTVSDMGGIHHRKLMRETLALLIGFRSGAAVAEPTVAVSSSPGGGSVASGRPWLVGGRLAECVS